MDNIIEQLAGSCGKHPKMFVRKDVHPSDEYHSLGIEKITEACILCLELDKVRAETLMQAAELVPNFDFIHSMNGRKLRAEIIALSPDPHYRERIKLEARIAEAEAWDSATTTSEHWNYSQSARKQWRDEHISILKFKLAALDAQSVANLPIDRGYCGRCGNSISECKCVADAPKGEGR